MKHKYKHYTFSMENDKLSIGAAYHSLKSQNIDKNVHLEN